MLIVPYTIYRLILLLLSLSLRTSVGARRGKGGLVEGLEGVVLGVLALLFAGRKLLALDRFAFSHFIKRIE